jgi:hypothetical protein
MSKFMRQIVAFAGSSGTDHPQASTAMIPSRGPRRMLAFHRMRAQNQSQANAGRAPEQQKGTKP